MDDCVTGSGELVGVRDNVDEDERLHDSVEVAFAVRDMGVRVSVALTESWRDEMDRCVTEGEADVVFVTATELLRCDTLPEGVFSSVMDRVRDAPRWLPEIVGVCVSELLPASLLRLKDRVLVTDPVHPADARVCVELRDHVTLDDGGSIEALVEYVEEYDALPPPAGIEADGV